MWELGKITEIWNPFEKWNVKGLEHLRTRENIKVYLSLTKTEVHSFFLLLGTLNLPWNIKSLTSRGGLHCGRGEKKVADQWSEEKTYNIQRCLRASEEIVTLSPWRWRCIGRGCAGEPPRRLRVEKARSSLLSSLTWGGLRDTASCPPRAWLGVAWSPWGQQEPVGQLSQHRAMQTMLPAP